ncbi:MAG: DeoR/GlpR transcriptional regulator [Thermotoga sp.]|nr:MAG: DeoR/GlpR transcriptional regulator [Thermotoga sp.]
MREERLSRMTNFIKSRGIVKLQELQDAFQVSSSTLRRDITELAKRGVLEKIHGGVKAVGGTVAEEEFMKRISKNRNLKEKVGSIALDLIEDGDVLFLDASSTVYVFSLMLRSVKNNLKIITTNLLTAIELSKNTTNDVIITTGKINPFTISTEDTLTMNTLKDFRAVKFVFSCYGFDPNEGTYEVNLQEANIKKIMFERSAKKYLLIDSSKFYRISGMFCFKTDDLDLIVTDSIHENELSILTDKGVEVLSESGG